MIFGLNKRIFLIKQGSYKKNIINIHQDQFLFIFSVFDSFNEGGGIPNLNMLIVFMNLYISIWSIYTKDLSYLTAYKRAIIELWCTVQVCHVNYIF